MGIHDRDYYRDETRGAGWFWGIAPTCKTIILINVGVFVFQWISPENRFDDYFAVRGTDIFERFQIWRLLTATFLHSQEGVFHILFNMLFLWFFGREMESMYGHREFARMYVTAAVFSTLCWAGTSYFGPGRQLDIPMIGASGAISAVVLLYTLYYPHQRVLVMFVIPLEMWMLALLYFGSDFLMLIRQLQGRSLIIGGSPAVAAHLGGALYGYLYKTYDLRWTRLLSERRHRPRMRVVSPPEPRDRVSGQPSASRAASAGAGRRAPSLYFPEEQLDAKLDEILAKIAREGRDGLTEDELRILEEASRRARNRRSDRV